VRAHDFSPNALIGYVPVNTGPLNVNSGAVGLAVSPDNRFLYVVNRIDTGDPPPQGTVCFLTYPSPPGTLSVIDIARAEQHPAQAVLAHVFVGCGPVRVVLSPSGDTAWVTVQENNVVKAFSTARLQSDPAHAQLATIPTGTAPTGEALVDDGTVLVVTNSNRFSQPDQPQTLSVFDTKQALQGHAALLATIHVGAFPRELDLEANGQTLLLTNYNSDTLSFINVAKLPGPA
jgi:DNA-binding beta-propeller fold protein YncE